MTIEFDDSKLNKKRLLAYSKYFSKYYNDRFKHNQGTEVILDLLKKYGGGANKLWLDVGAGSNTLFWSLQLSGVKEMHCTDKYWEPLKLLEDFLVSKHVPNCYREVMDMYGISDNQIELIRNLPRKYFQLDAIKEWPSNTRKDYDLITAFGVFGLSTSAEQYVDCFGYMYPFLKSNGLAIGANWVRSSKFIDKNGGDNRFLEAELVELASRKFGFKLKHLSKELIKGDEDYDSVIIWVLQKII